ncbi:copper chaperone PCu(A)C [Nocardiopsis mangrovi]|uniref:Copper chaperone PCu(A)C n=1 Tax=Nocardiopsis mangrovi TaxID=1179818 RepID=A0ABV9DU44_9ACTN
MQCRQAGRTPRRPFPALAGLSVLLLAAACGGAPGPAPATAPAGGAETDRGGASGGALDVAGAWIPEPANPEVGVVYLEVANAAGEDDAVTGVSTSASDDADLCATENGASARMRTVDEIPVPAGGSVTLADGGYHLMINDIAEPLAVGDRVTVTLTFASATELEFTVPVQTMTGAPGPEAGHGGHH